MIGDNAVLAGRYVLEREIGRGGMGAVWLGRDTVLERTVAIKQIGLTSAEAAPDVARAEREAHLTARVTHDHVVSVFDLVEDDGRHWLVMEHVEGPSLAAMIADRGALAPGVVAGVVAQVAGALAAAHQHGIVHRDVKPSNILLTADGTAKLTDFGVARAQADASLTQTGLVTGSPAYLPPEVATGRTATAASDVWSLGATAFHALAGHPPYEAGDHLFSTMHAIVHDEPPRLAGDGALADLVAAMMQQDPETRPTMSAVQHVVAALPALAAGLETVQLVSATEPDTVASTATSSFRPLAEPDPAPVAAPASPPASAPSHRTTDRSRPWLPALGAAAAVLAIAAVGVAVLGNGSDDPAAPPQASATTTSGAGDAEPSPATTLEGFASDYLTAASNDPESGFALLTPSYQRDSGGLEGYRSFWDNVSDLDVESVQGDAATNTVSYRYSYEYEGERRTEDVTLRLEPSGDGYLIAGTA